MAKSPKEVEEIIERAINAWTDLAPDKRFNNKSLEDFKAQAEKSMAPRRRLTEINNEEKEQIRIRETEDAKTIKMFESLVNGVKGDDDFGEDSAFYELLGFVRKSKRKTGNTRKRNSSETPSP